MLITPKLDDAVRYANSNFLASPEKKILLIAGVCQIRYSGRAQSFLSWGDRLVIIKADGNVIVHQPINREPVNWQPAGSKTTFKKENDFFILSSVHRKNKEQMKIAFRDIEMIYTTKMIDNASLQIVGMEKDIVDKIEENPEILEKNLRITQREKQTSCGLIDLYGYDENHTPVVIEVKRGQATLSAVQQLRMYVEDLKRGNPDAKIRGILCAPKIPEMVKRLADEHGFEHKEFGWVHALEEDEQKTIDQYPQ